MTGVERKIPVSEPYVTEDDVEFVANVLREKQISGRAPVVHEFEDAFAGYLGVKYASACSSGTSGLHLAVKSLEMKPGDEVIVPALTMMSPVFALLYEGLRPVLTDVDSKYWTMDPKSIRQKVGKHTKAILVVHTYGNPVAMDEIRELADSYDLFIIEDCAEALGASFRDGKVGTFGDVCVFSFFANKLITCGEGGIVCSNKEDIAEDVRSLRDLNFGKKNKFLHQDIGYNYRMSALQAALGYSQLKRIDSHFSRARRIAELYNEHLSDITSLRLHQEPPETIGSFWMYSIVLEPPDLLREHVAGELAKNGIETRPFFVPVHQQPPCSDLFRNEAYPQSEFLSTRGLNLPSGLSLTEGEISYICDAIRDAA